MVNLSWVGRRVGEKNGMLAFTSGTEARILI